MLLVYDFYRFCVGLVGAGGGVGVVFVGVGVVRFQSRSASV